MNKFLLEIITPARRAFTQEVDGVCVPTSRGMIGVLARHEPLFSALVEGEIKITDHNKVYYVAIGGGFMEVVNNHVSILVSRAVHADELNEAEIQKAMETAKDAIKNRAEGIQLGSAQAMLRRSMLELKVLRRRRSGSSMLPPREL